MAPACLLIASPHAACLPRAVEMGAQLYDSLIVATGILVATMIKEDRVGSFSLIDCIIRSIAFSFTHRCGESFHPDTRTATGNN